MNTPEELKLPHDDYSLLPFEWGWWEYLVLVFAAMAFVLLIGLGIAFYKKWMAKASEQTHSPLQLLRKEAMGIQVGDLESREDFGGVYGNLSRVLRSGLDAWHKTSLSSWNFEEISGNSDLLAKRLGEDYPKTLGFLGRADRCIYSGNLVDLIILQQDKKLVVETLDGLCQLELKKLEGNK